MIKIDNFLDRTGIERLFLERQFLFGKLLGFRKLRKWRIAVLRSLAAKSTNNPVKHIANGDEAKFQNQAFVGSFTKGLPHDDTTGKVIDPEQFKRFRVAIHSGDFFNEQQPDLGRDENKEPRWRAVNLDTKIRGWESPSAGLTFEMHGPDSHSVTMPPAPELGSAELTFEMAEVYWLALLRDVHFNQFQAGSSDPTLKKAIAFLNGFPEKGTGSRKRRLNQSDRLEAQNVFRGATNGDLIGAYLSQFLLIGSPGHENNQANVTQGLIGYGALKIGQKLIPAQSELDHMTTWDVFLDVQDAANLRGTDKFGDRPRFIKCPRDLATYVHFDALYEAYLNACLILLGFKAPADRGISQLNSIFSDKARRLSPGDVGRVDRVDGFALFGDAHILNLVTEVSTRALKAVRYQKFNVHCRLRPEAIGGWMEAINVDSPVKNILELKQMYDDLNQTLNDVNLFDDLKAYNGAQNAQEKFNERPYVRQPVKDLDKETVLLPMAFPEGSPMHPAYGAGHATVAGACVTILKAFFNTDAVFGRADNGDIKITTLDDYNKNNYSPVAFVPNNDGTCLEDICAGDSSQSPLTVGNELNKIAANVSIGRNMAGVHYYSDYIDSLIMGEKIAIGVLLEQSFAYETYPVKVRPSFSLTTFLGREFQIKDGKITEKGAEVEWSSLA